MTTIMAEPAGQDAAKAKRVLFETYVTKITTMASNRTGFWKPLYWLTRSTYSNTSAERPVTLARSMPNGGNSKL